MKFVCTQENLAHGLHVVSRAASKNIALPILNNVLLIAEHGAVRLETTNLEVAVTTSIRAKIEAEGRYTVNCRLLTDYISALKHAKITLEAVADGFLVQGDQSQTTIKGIPADEFPVLPTVSPDVKIQVPTLVLRTALQEVLFAAANDEARPEISGVCLRVDGSQLILVATDSYRLSERRITSVTASAKEAQVIIPGRAGQEILRILDSGAESSEVEFDGKQARVSSGETEIVTRLIEGQFPEYTQLVPAKHDTVAVVQKQDFLDAIKAASLFSQPGINDISIQLREQNEISFTAASTQAGQHHASVSAMVSGPEKNVVLNYRYLLDGVQSLSGDEVSIELSDPQAPVVLRSPKTSAAIYLIMPIRQ